MEAVVHVDTHVVVWLWAGDRDRLQPARDLLERAQIVACPMVRLELQYLFEIGRLRERPEAILADLAPRIGLRVATTPFAAVVERAAAMTWTRDPFDRLIAGNALADAARLLTRDETIRAHCPWATWG